MKRTSPWILCTFCFLFLGAVADLAAAQYRPVGGRGAHDSDGALRVRGGQFTPNGESEYWEDNQLDFTGTVDDFEDVVVGADYVHYFQSRLGLLVGGQVFEGDDTLAYLDFVDDQGRDILHQTTVEIASIDLGLIYHLTNRGSAISPYIGGGASLFAYTLIEDGDFIDFSSGDPEIFNGFFETDGNTVGAFALAGLEIPIGSSLAVFAEGRWHFADDDLDGDFEGFGEFDLSSESYSAGLSWRF